MEVMNKAIADLVPYDNNARTHSAEQVSGLATTIGAIRWTSPVLFDDAGIIAGHGRVKSAQRIYDAGGTILGPDGEALPPGTVPAIYMPGLSEAERKALILADNKHADKAGWDEELLRLELDGLKDLDFDLGLTGFDVADLESLFSPVGIDHQGDDHSGASPWERMNGDAKPGVVAQIGEISCRISEEAYATLLRDRPQADITAWLEGVIYAACGRS